MDIREGKPIHLQFGTWTCSIGDVYSVITVDLGLHQTLPRKDLPILVRLTTPFLDPSEAGIPQSAELDHILFIEDAFRNAFADRHKAVFAGHIYRGGGYEGYFYTPSYDGMPKTMDQVVASLPPESPPYKLEMAMRKDPEWSEYQEVLYPNPMGIQSILTAQVLNNLRQQGDNLSTSRPVHHQALFATKDQASEFARRVLKENFKVDSEDHNASAEDGYPFSLWISRVDSVQPQEIDYTVSWVFLQADECGGKFNGWVTKAHPSK